MSFGINNWFTKALYGNMGSMYIFSTSTTDFTHLSGTYTGAYSGEETSLENTVTLIFILVVI